MENKILRRLLRIIALLIYLIVGIIRFIITLPGILIEWLLTGDCIWIEKLQFLSWSLIHFVYEDEIKWITSNPDDFPYYDEPGI